MSLTPSSSRKTLLVCTALHPKSFSPWQLRAHTRGKRGRSFDVSRRKGASNEHDFDDEREREEDASGGCKYADDDDDDDGDGLRRNGCQASRHGWKEEVFIEARNLLGPMKVDLEQE